MSSRAVSRRESVVVIGLGNPLLGDDGLGLAALERLERGWTLPPEIELVDGGTWGLMLLPDMESAGSLLLIDAIETGQAPGTVVALDRDELPAFLDTKLSPHQVGLRDLFALLTLRGTMPRRTVAVGLVPAELEGTGGLSPEVRRGMDALVQRVVAQLRSWGLEPRPREPGTDDANAVGFAAEGWPGCTR